MQLKSLDKKIVKLEQAIKHTTDDPGPLLMKWEYLKSEKKNIPFVASSSKPLRPP
jgi:hypothetical protein